MYDAAPLHIPRHVVQIAAEAADPAPSRWWSGRRGRVRHFKKHRGEGGARLKPSDTRGSTTPGSSCRRTAAPTASTYSAILARACLASGSGRPAPWKTCTCLTTPAAPRRLLRSRAALQGGSGDRRATPSCSSGSRAGTGRPAKRRPGSAGTSHPRRAGPGQHVERHLEPRPGTRRMRRVPVRVKRPCRPMAKSPRASGWSGRPPPRRCGRPRRTSGSRRPSHPSGRSGPDQYRGSARSGYPSTQSSINIVIECLGNSR